MKSGYGYGVWILLLTADFDELGAGGQAGDCIRPAFDRLFDR